MGKSATVGTARIYRRSWSAWHNFMQEDVQSEDIYMLKWNEEDKSAGVSLFLLKRYKEGRPQRSTSYSCHSQHSMSLYQGSAIHEFSGLVTTGGIESGVQAKRSGVESTEGSRAKRINQDAIL